MLHFPRWKTFLVLGITILGLLLALPNVLPQRVLDALPEWLPHKTVHLGLDLRGGAHVVLEVEQEDLYQKLAEPVIDDIRSALREARIGYTGLRRTNGSVTVTIRESDRVDEAARLIRNIAQPVSGGLFSQGMETSEFTVDVSGTRITATFTQAGIESRVSRAIQQSIEIIRRRVDELGTTEPNIQRQGLDRVLVQVPGLEDSSRLINLLGQTARLQFRLLCEDQPTGSERVPPGCARVVSMEDPNFAYFVQTGARATVEGEHLTDAQPGFDSQTNEPIVLFRFNQTGAVRFGRLTQENVGRPFAIVLDDQVISAPVIREPILGGSGQISGNFTVQEANDLAILLRAGALPVNLVVVEERTVGPSLGADSIAAGTLASIVGTIAVIVFMAISYGLFGIFANIALLANVGMIIGALSLLQATLTLPGIAGIVLTVGMAVDANVLVFERIREEIRQGKSPIAAIDAGYSRAIGTIMDANLTTLIAAIIMFGMGSGPVRGFAVTLSIGIVTSVFSAVTLNRLIVSWWLRRFRPAAVPV